MVARDLARQDDVLAEVRERRREQHEGEPEREDAEAPGAELSRHDHVERDRRELRARPPRAGGRPCSPGFDAPRSTLFPQRTISVWPGACLRRLPSHTTVSQTCRSAMTRTTSSCVPTDLRRQSRSCATWGYSLVSFGEFADEVARSGGAGTPRSPSTTGSSTTSRRSCPLVRELDATATVFVGLGLARSVASRRPVDADRDRRRATRASRRGHRDRRSLGQSRRPEQRSRTTRRWKSSSRGKRELEEVLDEPVEVVAYPYGRDKPRFDPRGRDAGFRAACSTSARGSWDDPSLPAPAGHGQPAAAARPAAEARRPLRAADEARFRPAPHDESVATSPRRSDDRTASCGPDRARLPRRRPSGGRRRPPADLARASRGADPLSAAARLRVPDR